MVGEGACVQQGQCIERRLGIDYLSLADVFERKPYLFPIWCGCNIRAER